MNELSKVEFSNPKICYECHSLYRNPQGQEFVIRVRGNKKASLEKIISSFYASLEIINDEPIPLLLSETLSTDLEVKESSSEPGEGNKNLESLTEATLTESIELTDALELVIEAPKNLENQRSSLFKFNWSLSLDSINRLMLPIDPGVTFPRRIPGMKQCKATVSVSSGVSVYAWIDGGIPLGANIAWKGQAFQHQNPPLILQKKSANDNPTNFTLNLKPVGGTATVHVKESIWNIV